MLTEGYKRPVRPTCLTHKISHYKKLTEYLTGRNILVVALDTENSEFGFHVPEEHWNMCLSIEPFWYLPLKGVFDSY